MTTEYPGIDYGRGQSNIDHDTGIRYGVINQNEVLQAWADSSEADYGDAECPECQGDAVDYDNDKHGDWDYEKHECADYACEECKKVFGSESAFPEEAYSYYFIDDGYQAECSDDMGDIFITKSPYFTYCQFCSPCAPGAGYLINPVKEENGGVKTYCFGHDWFEEKETGNIIECQYCNGTGIRPEDRDTPLGLSCGTGYVPCWACEKGKVKEMTAKAPYPVYSVETGDLVD